MEVQNVFEAENTGLKSEYAIKKPILDFSKIGYHYPLGEYDDWPLVLFSKEDTSNRSFITGQISGQSEFLTEIAGILDDPGFQTIARAWVFLLEQDRRKILAVVREAACTPVTD